MDLILDYPLSFFKSLTSRLMNNKVPFFDKLKLSLFSLFIYFYYQFYLNHQSFGLIIKKY